MHFESFSKTKERIRKPIETNFLQLHGQFLWMINHAKSFKRLVTRFLSKITAFTMIQYFDLFVFNRPMNKKPKVNLY